MDVPDDARPDVLRDPDARLDRRARGGARRGAAADRRRLPEPARRRATADRPPPGRPDGDLRDDTVELDEARRSTEWQEYVFWNVPEGAARRTWSLPPELAGLPDVPGSGLPIPGPICTPSLASIDAALAPDTEEGYHLLPRDARRIATAHAFAKTSRGARRRTAQVRLPVTASPIGALADPADFAAPPDAGGPRPLGRGGPRGSARHGWRGSGRAFAATGVDAYFGVRREHMRYLTGFALGEGEEKVAGHSGQFLVGGDEVVVLADSRYTIQARREASGSAARRGRLRPAGRLGAARRIGRGAAGRGRGRLRAARALAAARGGRAGRRAGADRGLGRGRPGDEGAGRARAGRGGLRRRGPGAGRAPAGDPAGRHRARRSRSSSSG